MCSSLSPAYLYLPRITPSQKPGTATRIPIPIIHTIPSSTVQSVKSPWRPRVLQIRQKLSIGAHPIGGDDGVCPIGQEPMATPGSANSTVQPSSTGSANSTVQSARPRRHRRWALVRPVEHTGWFDKGNKTSPLTNEVLESTNLIPNLTLKKGEARAHGYARTHRTRTHTPHAHAHGTRTHTRHAHAHTARARTHRTRKSTRERTRTIHTMHTTPSSHPHTHTHHTTGSDRPQSNLHASALSRYDAGWGCDAAWGVRSRLRTPRSLQAECGLMVQPRV